MAEVFAFAATCVLLIITPGPGVLSVAGVGAGFGFAAGSKYLWGLCLGNFLVALAVISGLAAAALAIPYVRETLLVVSIAYIFYLAVKIAFAGSRIGIIEAKTAPRLFDGVMLQAVNPKAYLVNSLLFSGFGIFAGNIVLEMLIKISLWVAIWIPIHFAWLAAGVFINRLDLSVPVQRTINIFMAASMLIVVALAVYSEL